MEHIVDEVTCVKKLSPQRGNTLRHPWRLRIQLQHLKLHKAVAFSHVAAAPAAAY